MGIKVGVKKAKGVLGDVAWYFNGKPPNGLDGDFVRALVVSDAVRSAKQPGHNGRHPHGLEEIHILR